MGITITEHVVRQTEEQYRWAEYQRRIKDEEAAWDRRTELEEIKRAANERAEEFRRLCDEAGINPFEGDPGRLEQHLWDRRCEAVRDREYAAAVWRNKSNLMDQARERWMEAASR